MVESALRQQRKNLKLCPVLVDHYNQSLNFDQSEENTTVGVLLVARYSDQKSDICQHYHRPSNGNDGTSKLIRGM